MEIFIDPGIFIFLDQFRLIFRLLDYFSTLLRSLDYVKFVFSFIKYKINFYLILHGY